MFWAVRMVATENSRPRRIATMAITEGIQPSTIPMISGHGVKEGPS